jgi:hypothetical protein
MLCYVDPQAERVEILQKSGQAEVLPLIVAIAQNRA